MRISFSPQRREDALVVTRAGDTLVVNGDPIDFSGIADGGTLPADATESAWITGDVRRIDGVLHVTLLLPHGPDPSPAMAFPEPVSATADGPVTVPRDPSA